MFDLDEVIQCSLGKIRLLSFSKGGGIVYGGFISINIGTQVSWVSTCIYALFKPLDIPPLSSEGPNFSIEDYLRLYIQTSL